MKVCFVGIGSIAKRHIRNLSEICNVKGIELQIDALRRSHLVGADNLQQIGDVYTSAEELPADYDVVFLTNPTEYHADMLLKLHDHAKHFFIEKPVASLNTVDILKEIPYREDSVYYVACPLRYTNVIQYLKQEINIEAVNSVRCISSSYLPDWRPGQDYRETYSAHKDMGGGVSIDLVHEWDYITYLFGMPLAVKSFLGKVSNLEIDSDDYAIYIAKYDNIIAELHLDYFGRQSIRNVELYMDEDTVVGDFIAGTITYLRSGKIINLPADRDIYQKRELERFLDMVSKNGKCSNDIANAVKILKLTQGITE